MASSEFVIPSTALSIAFPALAAGTAAVAPGDSALALATLSKFYPGVSKVIGVQRVTAGGAPARVSLTAAAGATGSTLTLTGAAGDTSIYRAFWVNETAGSLLPC
jgi:hypothetical protein